MSDIIFKGSLELVEQKWGNISPQLLIGNMNVTTELWRLFGGSDMELFKVDGKWELTLRKIK